MVGENQQNLRGIAVVKKPGIVCPLLWISLWEGGVSWKRHSIFSLRIVSKWITRSTDTTRLQVPRLTVGTCSLRCVISDSQLGETFHLNRTWTLDVLGVEAFCFLEENNSRSFLCSLEVIRISLE